MSDIWFTVGNHTVVQEANRIVKLVNLGPSEVKVEMQDGETFIVREDFYSCITRIREHADD